jgi:tRNA modification GTPase
MTAAGASSRDVIVALATAPGNGPMAVVRASGDGAVEALRRVDARMPEGPMRRCVRAAELRLSAGPLPCLVACMPGPHSYTGEDAFELFVPGHAEVVRLVLHALTQSPGVREAGPGEFTLRAFEQGRLTLEQAEGVAATIAARTDAEVHAAAMLRSGTIGTRVHHVSETVADLLALVEAGIDFTDQEDVVAIGRAELCAGIDAAMASLREMIDGSVPLERLAATPWVVLAGAPNAGKSALFNALLGRQRAVVAAVAGTTRDVLVEPWRVPATSGTLEVLLVDAPGEMREAQGDVRDQQIRLQLVHEEVEQRARVHAEAGAHEVRERRDRVALVGAHDHERQRPAAQARGSERGPQPRARRAASISGPSRAGATSTRKRTTTSRSSSQRRSSASTPSATASPTSPTRCRSSTRP